LYKYQVDLVKSSRTSSDDTRADLNCQVLQIRTCQNRSKQVKNTTHVRMTFWRGHRKYRRDMPNLRAKTY
ncbi:hypothetical protein SK128_010217, partial [Halocaridina rubra]